MTDTEKQIKERIDAIDYIIDTAQIRLDGRINATRKCENQMFCEELATKFNITYGDISSRTQERIEKHIRDEWIYKSSR